MHHSITTVHLVHPYPLEREAIAFWLSKRSFLDLKGKGSKVPEVSGPGSSDDIEMLIYFNYHGADAAQQIIYLRKTNPSLKILIAADIENTDAVSEVVHCGVHGFIDVYAPVEEWEWAIKSVAQGKVYYAQQVMKLLAGSTAHNTENQSVSASKHFLSKREIEVLMLVASEYSTNRIADKLFISSKTVESHRRNLFQKLGVKNSVGLTKVAVRLGVI